MNRNKWILLITITLVVILYYSLDLGRYLTLASLKANREIWVGFYHKNRLLTVFVFMLLYIIQTALSLPGATFFSLGAGLIFGSMLGTFYAVIAATIGAAMAFLGARYFLRDAIKRKFAEKLKSLNTSLGKDGIHYLLFLRLVPAFPFFLVNLGAALTDIPLRTFVVGTLVGIIPGAFVYVNAGASLATINSLGDIATPRVLGSFALIGFFALLPVLISKIKSIRLASEEGR